MRVSTTVCARPRGPARRRRKDVERSRGTSELRRRRARVERHRERLALAMINGTEFLLVSRPVVDVGSPAHSTPSRPGRNGARESVIRPARGLSDAAQWCNAEAVPRIPTCQPRYIRRVQGMPGDRLSWQGVSAHDCLPPAQRVRAEWEEMSSPVARRLTALSSSSARARRSPSHSGRRVRDRAFVHVDDFMTNRGLLERARIARLPPWHRPGSRIADRRTRRESARRAHELRKASCQGKLCVAAQTSRRRAGRGIRTEDLVGEGPASVVQWYRDHAASAEQRRSRSEATTSTTT